MSAARIMQALGFFVFCILMLTIPEAFLAYSSFLRIRLARKIIMLLGVCLPFQLLNQLTYFHRTWFEHYVTVNNSACVPS
jgi:hypothetical protein